MPGRPPPIIRIANGTFYRHHPSSVPVTSPGSQPSSQQSQQHHRSNPPLFKGLNFQLPDYQTDDVQRNNWCVVGPSLSGKTTLLQILRGQHICLPPTARAFPYLATDAVPQRLKSASRAIRYVGFDAEGSSLGPATSAYLSARYESRREITDFSLRDYLLGNTELNPLEVEDDSESIPPALVDRIVRDLKLDRLLDLPVSFLSNGQGRRARIARALLTRPAVLLLDEPFMGLDPPTVASLNPLLRDMAEQARPRLLLTSRPQDPLPSWITHLVYLRTDCRVAAKGPLKDVLSILRNYYGNVRDGNQAESPELPIHAMGEMGRLQTDTAIEGQGFEEGHAEDKRATAETTVSVGGSSLVPPAAGKPADPAADDTPPGEPVVEMDGCRVQYGDRIALGNWDNPQPDGPSKPGLQWTVRRGERWGVFGPNGSGKTTIVSLLCSDHPQTYSLPIRLFGRSRLPEPGSGERPLTFWDIQARVGHSSPEVHQHMPRSLTVRQIVESAWADTFRSKPKLTDDAPARVDAALRWFQPELCADETASSSAPSASMSSTSWADDSIFGELSFSAQRVLLFVRAVVKNPDIVVLDEAFSGMDESVRDKCALFLSHGESAVVAENDAGFAESGVSKAGQVKVPGLSADQALICIAHVKEEVPDCVREWICLPETNTTGRARFGRLDGPLRTDRRRWESIWAGAMSEA